MQTPKSFDPITRGFGNADALNQWVTTVLPSGVKGRDFLRAPTAWVDSVQSLLRGSDSLRHMQLEAIHTAQKNTSALGKALAHAKGADDATVAWRRFSEDTLQNSLEYWTAYNAIVQHTEIEMLNQVRTPFETLANPGPRTDKSTTRPGAAAKSPKAAKRRARRAPAARH